MREPVVYYLEGDQLETLKRLADQLQGGSDNERDIGHRLWLVVTAVRDQPIIWGKLQPGPDDGR